VPTGFVNRIAAIAAWIQCRSDELSCSLGISTQRSSKPDISPDWRWRIPMKTLFLAAFAALTLTVAVAPVASAANFHNGSTVAGDAAATRLQQTGGYSR
jgi:hypothetical protein